MGKGPDNGARRDIFSSGVPMLVLGTILTKEDLAAAQRQVVVVTDSQNMRLTDLPCSLPDAKRTFGSLRPKPYVRQLDELQSGSNACILVIPGTMG